MDYPFGLVENLLFACSNMASFGDTLFNQDLILQTLCRYTKKGLKNT